MLVKRDSAALDLDQLRATLDACTIQVVSLEQRNELLRSRMTARRREIEVSPVCWLTLPEGCFCACIRHEPIMPHVQGVPCACHPGFMGHLGPACSVHASAVASSAASWYRDEADINVTCWQAATVC